MNSDLKTEIKILQRTEVAELFELIAVFEEVFEMENLKRPSEAHLLNLLQSDNFFAVVAKSENRVIAGMTIYILDQYYSEKPLAYLYDLAVLTEYQRKGVGKNLIKYTIEYCRQRGFKEVFVQADKVDGYAIDFYRLTKPSHEEQVVHFSYNLEKDNEPTD